MWLARKTCPVPKFRIKGECADHFLLKPGTESFWKSLEVRLWSNTCVEVCLMLLFESGWRIRDSWLLCTRQGSQQMLPARNYEHEHHFILIINHHAIAPSNMRKKRGHVYISWVVAFDLKKHSSNHHREGKFR